MFGIIQEIDKKTEILSYFMKRSTILKSGQNLQTVEVYTFLAWKHNTCQFGYVSPAVFAQLIPYKCLCLCSIRAQFGLDIKANAVHGPATEENAKSVINEIFGDLKTNPDGTVDAGK